MSASDNEEPAFGGIAPLPLTTEAANASAPSLIRGAHAALSPSFGAMLLWQAAQVLSYTAFPSAAATGPAATSAAITARATTPSFISFSFHVNQALSIW